MEDNLKEILDHEQYLQYCMAGAHIFDDNLSNIIRKLENSLYKQALEDARYILPNACETKIMVTMNARSLLNFFNKRSCNRAQWEIRHLSDLMLAEVRKVAPILFLKAGAPCTYGKCPEGEMTCGQPRKPEDYLTK